MNAEQFENAAESPRKIVLSNVIKGCFRFFRIIVLSAFFWLGGFLIFTTETILPELDFGFARCVMGYAAMATCSCWLVYLQEKDCASSGTTRVFLLYFLTLLMIGVLVFIIFFTVRPTTFT